MSRSAAKHAPEVARRDPKRWGEARLIILEKLHGVSHPPVGSLPSVPPSRTGRNAKSSPSIWLAVRRTVVTVDDRDGRNNNIPLTFALKKVTSSKALRRRQMYFFKNQISASAFLIQTEGT